jgi:hypothetical protein
MICPEVHVRREPDLKRRIHVSRVANKIIFEVRIWGKR